MQMKCSPSTVDVFICRGLEVLCDQLRSTLINPTDPAEVAAADDGFTGKFGRVVTNLPPGLIGAVDGVVFRRLNTM